MGKLVLGLLLLAQVGWSEGLDPSSAIQAHFDQGDLVALGAVPDSRWDPHGSATPRVDYQKLLAGGYKGKVFEIECLPFSFETGKDGAFRYWAYGTDDTGFGWMEDQPIIVESKEPLDPVDTDGRIRALATLAGIEQDVLYNQDTGESRTFPVPVFDLSAP